MVDCFVCGKPFDNELWLLGNAPDGDPELTVFKNRRCLDCWKGLKRDSECRIHFGEDIERLKKTLVAMWSPSPRGIGLGDVPDWSASSILKAASDDLIARAK